MPTYFALGLGENLAETLDIGNWTTDGQKIRALNGTSSLNLRVTVDNEILLTNDDIAFLLAYLIMQPTSVQVGFNGSTGLYLEVNATEVGFKTTGLSPFFGMNAAGGGLLSITEQIGTRAFTIMSYSDLGVDIIQNALTDFLFLNTGLQGVADSKCKAGVRRSPLVGGKGLTAKTSDTLYTNQISYQESLNLFDNIIKPPTVATQDNTHTLQNKTGTIAHLSDTVDGSYIEKWTLYNATLNATWETIVITDAEANSIIEITCENNSLLTRSMGVRQVGSILDRRLTITLQSGITLLVKTNSAKEIQVYASVFADVNFYFSAQL